jgi:hypothetical protein
MRNAEGLEFERKRTGLGRFVHSWPKFPMNCNRRSNDCARGLMIGINDHRPRGSAEERAREDERGGF